MRAGVELRRRLTDLFELEAPAAMVRGNSDWPQGVKVDGRFIFRAEDDAAYPLGAERRHQRGSDPPPAVLQDLRSDVVGGHF